VTGAGILEKEESDKIDKMVILTPKEISKF